MSGSEAARSVSARMPVFGCPIVTCEWTLAQGAPDAGAPGPVVPGVTLEESISLASLAILTEWYAEAESAVEAHLSTHSLLEWVTEVMRLRNAAAGTVAVSREDLALVHDYARHFDVDTDPAMVRVAEVLRGSEQPAGSSPPAAD